MELKPDEQIIRDMKLDKDNIKVLFTMQYLRSFRKSKLELTIMNIKKVTDLAGNHIILDKYSIDVGPYIYVSESDTETNLKLSGSSGGVVTAVGATGGVVAGLTSTLGASAMPSMVAFMQLLQYA
jgi:hypothetical protein